MHQIAQIWAVFQSEFIAEIIASQTYAARGIKIDGKFKEIKFKASKSELSKLFKLIANVD